MRFLQESKDKADPGIRIHFSDPPTYSHGFCAEDKIFTMPEGPDRVWMISKDNSNIKLSCNDEVIFDNDYSASTESGCKEGWSRDFVLMQFQSTDTASDYYRPYSEGKQNF